MRERTLRKQLVLGAMVAVVTAVVAPGVWLALRDAVEAVRAGDGSTATAQGVTAVVLVAVPVLALAAYAHWLTATTRRRPADVESTDAVGATAGIGTKLLVGVLVLGLLAVAWPLTRWLALTARDSWTDGALTTAVPAALAVPAYLAFVAFCVVRYLRWLRRRSPARRGW